jgi:RHS repeat-associated protein
LLELDGASADAVLRRYTWGLDVAGLAGKMNSLAAAGGIGGLLAVQDAGASQDYVYFHDALGSVGQVLDLAAQTAGAAMVAKYEYDPYGNQTGVAGTYDQPFRFSGKYHDAETGLGYWGYRYYNPVLGRWINRDPLGEPGGLNLYAYCANEPPRAVDALGLSWLWGDGHGCPPGMYFHPDFGCVHYLAPVPPPEQGGPLPPIPPTPPAPPSPDKKDPGEPSFQPWPIDIDLNIWGYYCGPGISGPGEPIDGTDAACKGHDECYAKYGIPAFSPYTPARCQCDAQLIRDLPTPESPEEAKAQGKIRAVFCVLMRLNHCEEADVCDVVPD